MCGVGRLADISSAALAAVIVSVMLGLAALAMSMVAGPVMLFFAIYGLRLFGQGMMTHLSQTLMGRWFVATRGRALALSGFGFPFSEAIFPIVVVALLALFEWRQVWLIAACILVFVSAPVLWWLLRHNRIPRGTADAAAGAEGARASQRQWTRAEVLRDPVFFLLLPAFLAPSFIGTGIFFHQVHLTQYKGWALAWFAGFFPFYAGISVLTALVAGVLVDRWSARRVLPAVLLPQALGAAALGLFDDPLVVPFVMAGLGLDGGHDVHRIGCPVAGNLWRAAPRRDPLAGDIGDGPVHRRRPVPAGRAHRRGHRVRFPASRHGPLHGGGDGAPGACLAAVAGARCGAGS